MSARHGGEGRSGGGDSAPTPHPAPAPRAERELSDLKVRLWKKVIWFSAGGEMNAGFERCIAARGKVRFHGGG